MINISYGTVAQSRVNTIEYVQTQRQQKPFRVIDLGGTAVNGQEDLSGQSSWSRGIVDLTVDINAPNTPGNIQMDLCDANDWPKLFSVVEQQGLFDYAICTHTLEDLYNPITVLKNLPNIAKAGIVTTPSARTELSNPESTSWLGYMHHRWIFDQRDGEILIAPKLSWIENRYKGLFSFDRRTEEICFQWEENLSFTVLMDNYLGPTSNAVLTQYDALVNQLGGQNRRQL